MVHSVAYMATLVFIYSWGFVGIVAWLALRIPSKSEKRVAELQAALDTKDDEAFFGRLPGVVRQLSPNRSLFKWVPFFDEPPLEDRDEYYGFFHYHFAVIKTAGFDSVRFLRNMMLFFDLFVMLPLVMMLFFDRHFSYLLFFVFYLPWLILFVLITYAIWKYPLCSMQERELFERVHARLIRMMDRPEERLTEESD
jgi:hypothetical protein